jgi:LEA14-like dessication related protein
MANIVLKRKNKTSRFLTGANCDLYVDGVKMRSVTSFNFHVDAKGVAKVTMELVVNSLNEKLKTLKKKVKV